MNTAYRVWDGEQMHYWNDEGLSLTIKNNGDWTLKRLEADVLVPVVDSTNRNAALMWHIGLLDKNNKAIYEKDIDMLDWEPMIVVYENGHYGLKFLDGSAYFDSSVDWEECEISGNPYENPELLEGVE
ncbi:YopX family protein [Bacillus halotolerans]|uniref:YopX family protein n=1 Tax=Bacillus halotolerans TaxID=260554 RepID=UPI002DBD46AF|nr:YopX family protein [Bacillus halotolerans]MEC1648541.1 YopX family protein [Bacillus halotolerans]